MRFRPGPYLGVVAVIGIVYFGAARVGLRLGVVEQVTAVWPPTGIALAAMICWGYRIWPGIALGAFLVNVWANEPIATAAGIAVGNTLEALTGAWLLRRVVGFHPSLGRLQDALGLVFLAAGCSTTVSATIGVTSLCLGGVQPWSRYGALWEVWWLGDAMGDLVVAPLLLTGSLWLRLAGQPRRLAETAALLGGLIVLSLLALTGGGMEHLARYSLEYSVFPFVIWAALRLGTQTTSLATFVASAVAIGGTVQGLGPFAAVAAVGDRLTLLQLFLVAVAVTGLVLAAATAERQQASDALRHGHGILHAVTEGTTDAVFVKDREGRYLMINAAGARFLDKTVEEVLGKDDTELFSPETAQAIRDRDRQVMATGYTQTYEEVGTAAGVTRTFFSTKGPYRDAEGKVIGLLGIARDITERKQAEEEHGRLLAREQEARAEAERLYYEVQAADRRKDEFLAMLAHELRNPLAPIRNAAEVLKGHVATDPALQNIHDVIDRQVRHLTRLVDDLLDVSRFTRGKVKLQKETVELAALVARGVETSRPLLEAHHQELIVALPSEPIWLEADAIRLAQVVANLLNNASKYTPDGGRVCVTARSEGDEVLLSVRDTGVGIPAELLPRVFDLFAQGEHGLARSTGGLGIGLTLVRSLVAMHGGTVQASSAGPGKGSEFVVRLPAVSGPVAPLKSPRTEATVTATRPARVLVVDDNEDVASTLGLVLRMRGHEVRLAYDGPTAIQEAKRYQPEVVLLDIGLPGLDGFEVARQLRQQAGLGKALLVAVTGYCQDEDRRLSREAGFDHHLIKPVDPAELVQLLAAQVGAGQASPS